MKRLIALCLALVVSAVGADTTNNVLSGTSWTGVTTGTLPANRMPGSALLYDTATGTVNWSYNTATASKTIAINNALSGSGVQVSGYNYAYDLRNMNGDDRQGSVDTMSVVTKMTSNTGATLLTNTNTHNTKFDWTTFTGSQSLSTPAALGNLGNLSISFTSRDTGFWSGYFGPEVRNVGMSLNFSVDQCSSNPLSSTSCPGYQQAYTDQQCAANPLYATSCAGYAAAYMTQQCSANPLYSTACPGYTQAYHDYQCSANPLYASDCVGYTQAYHDQQCSVNPLYATDCSGYAAAYAAQQAAILAAQRAAEEAARIAAQQLAAQQAAALAAQQAAILAAQQAAFAAQCSANPLLSVNCPGYAAAFAAQQAAIQQAAFTAQCNANPLSSTSCPGYQVALNKKNATDTAIKQSAPIVETVVVSSPTTTIASVPGISDPVVSAAVSAPSTTSTTSPTSVTSVLPQPPSTSTISAAVAPAAPAPAPSAETKQEAKKTEGAVAKAVAKGVAAAAKEATATAANAKSLEDQVATQGLVVGLMGYVPGFNAYQNAIVPDALAAQVARQYMKPNVDNRNAQRRLSGASDVKWQEMVDSQYKIGDR